MAQRLSRGAAALAAVTVLVCAVSPAACRGRSTATLTLDDIRVGPPARGDDTLCRLIVRVTNHGTVAASRLRFAVTLNGRAVAAYERAIYFTVVEPGESRDIRLFNFWSTEPSRPAPADNQLRIEVALRDAVWTTSQNDPDGVRTSLPRDRVPALPSVLRAILSLDTGTT